MPPPPRRSTAGWLSAWPARFLLPPRATAVRPRLAARKGPSCSGQADEEDDNHPVVLACSHVVSLFGLYDRSFPCPMQPVGPSVARRDHTGNRLEPHKFRRRFCQRFLRQPVAPQVRPAREVQPVAEDQAAARDARGGVPLWRVPCRRARSGRWPDPSDPKAAPACPASGLAQCHTRSTSLVLICLFTGSKTKNTDRQPVRTPSRPARPPRPDEGGAGTGTVL